MCETNKVFVGKLPYKCIKDDLYEHFSEIGEVEDAIVITDRETGRSRGFGFVTFKLEKDARDAIKQLHDSELMGRNITVNEAETKSSGGGRRGGGYSRGGGYGGDRRYQGERRNERNDYYGGGGGGYRSGGRYAGGGGGYGDNY